jgi:hypothetical protein
MRIRYLDPAHPGWVYHAHWCGCWECWDVHDGFFESWIG